MKKRLAIFLSLLTALGSLTACGNQNNPSGAQQPGGTEDGSRIVLRILSSQGQGEFPEGADENNNIFVDYLREVTPYDFEFTFYKLPEDRNALIASGTQYDMIRIGGTEGLDMLKLQQQGYLAPVDDFLAGAPNVTDTKQTPASAWSPCTVDGKRYAIPCSWMEQYFAFAMRVDWLEKLGLAEPKTLEEFKQVLIAFRDGDPDGNGENDTIPLTSTNQLPNLIRLFRGFWGIQGDYMDMGGKVAYTLATPEGEEMVSYMAELFQEGLIDPEFATMTEELAGQRVTSDQAAACAVDWWTLKQWDKTFQEAGGSEESPFWWVTPPANVKGEPTKFQSCGPIEQMLLFPVGGHTKEAVDYLNTILEPEVAQTLTFGFKGTHWDEDESGARYLTEEYNNIVWRWHYCDGIMFNHEMMAESENLEYGPYRIPAQEFAGNEASWSLPLPPIVGIEQQQTDIREYAELQVIKFIMGERPMSEYGAFIDELNQKGLAEVLEKMQAVYKP